MIKHFGSQAKLILIVEDNTLDARLMLHAFSQCEEPSCVTVVDSGTACLAFLRNEGCYANAQRPDLIILDLNIPGKSGHEVLAEIKHDTKLCQIPVVIFSGSNEEIDVAASYRGFANGYMVKPMRPEDFIAKIQALQAFWLSAVELPHRA